MLRQTAQQILYRCLKSTYPDGIGGTVSGNFCNFLKQATLGPSNTETQCYRRCHFKKTLARRTEQNSMLHQQSCVHNRTIKCEKKPHTNWPIIFPMLHLALSLKDSDQHTTIMTWDMVPSSLSHTLQLYYSPTANWLVSLPMYWHGKQHYTHHDSPGCLCNSMHALAHKFLNDGVTFTVNTTSIDLLTTFAYVQMFLPHLSCFLVVLTGRLGKAWH